MGLIGHTGLAALANLTLSPTAAGARKPSVPYVGIPADAPISGFTCGTAVPGPE